MVPGLVVLVSLALCAVRFRKSQPLVVFTIAAAGILLLIPSNLIVVTGFVLAERTLFLPSVMILIGVAAALPLVMDRIAESDRQRTRLFAACAASVLVALGVMRSAARGPVWHDNSTLIEHTVQDAPMSARAHMMRAQLMSDRGRGREAIEETVVALKLGPQKDSQMFAFAADMFQMAGNCRVASGLYARSLGLRPDQPQVRINASVCAARLASAAR
jgi:hypothetical protein